MAAQVVQVLVVVRVRLDLVLQLETRVMQELGQQVEVLLLLLLLRQLQMYGPGKQALQAQELHQLQQVIRAQ
jgi:hypothetical protein